MKLPSSKSPDANTKYPQLRRARAHHEGIEDFRQFTDDKMYISARMTSNLMCILFPMFGPVRTLT